MSWLRSNWKAVVAVVGLIVTFTGWLSAAHYRGIAEAEAATATRQAAALMIQHEALERDRQRRVQDSLALETARASDSAKRDSLTSVRRTLNAVRAELARRRTLANMAMDSLGAAVLAQADSAGVVDGETARAYVLASDEALAAADSAALIEGRRADTEGQRADIAEAAEARERTTAERLRVDLSNTELFAAGQTELLATKDRQIEALERAVAPSFGVRLLDNWELVALGALIGAVGWELAR